MNREELPQEASREDKMRDALKHYEELATRACWHRSDIPDAIRAYYASLPPAEGAEEIEAELRGYARDIVRLHKPIMEVNPQLAMDSIGNDLVKMFNRLAQRIAEKMVSENLVEFGNMIMDEPNGDIAALAEYFIRTINLKSREK